MAQSDDAATSGAPSTAVADVFPTHNVGKPEMREMPAEPKQYWRLIGPGIIAAGVGLASGEFILYPYIASQVGLVFVWAALGVAVLIWSIVLFGTLSVLTFRAQLESLFGG